MKEMLLASLLAIFLCFIDITGLPYEAVKDGSSGRMYLLRKEALHLLPTAETARYLGFNPDALRSITADEKYNISSAIKSVRVPAPNPDAAIENMLIKVNALSPQSFWRGMHYVPMFNPSIAKWKDKYLIAYRNESNISLTWLRHLASGAFEPVWADTFLGLRDKYGNNPWNNTISTSRFREDPRLLIRGKGAMASLSFVRLMANFDTAQMSYINLTLNAEHHLQFSCNEVLMVGGKQKNWVPFEHGAQQYWISSINPLHIVRHAFTTHNMNDNDALQAHVETVVEAEAVQLPWAEEYGLPIRGGTPAIMVKGVYLHFFHTLSSFQSAFALQTYFMGAMTFCPEPPFKIHSMSAHPILQDQLYQGQWHNTHRDYVVFPGGLAVDDAEEFVHMSFGHQDGHGFIAKFDVAELWKSLEIVHACS